MPLDSGSLRSALLRQHWLDVQRHVYGHSAHGFATTIPGGWDVFNWERDNRRGLLACARPFARVEPLRRFLAAMPDWPVLIEVEGDELDEELTAAGFEPDCLLPGHFIPTSDDFRSRFRFVIRPTRLVTNAETLADFAYVQDQAYRATYDWPKGCASLFYTDPASLIGPDVAGIVLYDANGLPVRTASIVHKRGIVAGVAGAAVPSVRGKHFGEQLMFELLYLARQWWGAEYVHHITMPCAVPIATRLGLETVTMYYRWSRPCS